MTSYKYSNILLLKILLIGALLNAGCAALPFGEEPIIHEVEPDSFNSSQLIDWYKFQRYQGGYWLHPADRGTYLLISMGQRKKDYEIHMGGISRNRYGNVKVDFSFDTLESDTTKKVFYPHDLFLIQPSVGRNQLVIREHRRNTIKKLRLDKTQLQKKVASLKKQNKRLSEVKSKLTEARNFLQDKLSSAQAQIRTKNTKIQTQSDSIAQQSNSLKKLRNNNQQLKNQLTELRGTVKRLNNQLDKRLKERQKKSNQRKSQPLLDLTFGNANYELTDQQKQKIQQMVQNLGDDTADVSLSIVGSADPRPVKKPELKNNLYLSFLRAWSVTEYLIQETPLTANNITPIASGTPPEEEIESTKANLRATKIYKIGSNPVKIQ